MEILQANNFIASDEIIETIYFGGGTPSLLSYAELKNILTTIKNKFPISVNAEITLEANPDDISENKLLDWKKIGINRLSVGVQSFNDEELQWMNRAHNAEDSAKCIDRIIDAGFTNFSIDLIYGSNIQSSEILLRNLELVCSKNIPHISAYALTVESGTKLNLQIQKGLAFNIDEDKQAEQFYTLVNHLEKAGYEQYEISNFAKQGFRSRHNSSYWQGSAYYGFGPSAHSYNGKNIRHANIANNALYISNVAAGKIIYEKEILSSEQLQNEYIMTALRISDGINLEKFRINFGEIAFDRIISQSKKYIESSYLYLGNNFLCLTKSGKFLADGIAANLFC